MYDQIAQDWKNKRQHPWKPLVSILEPYLKLHFSSSRADQEQTSIFLDVGAGSGRHSEFLQQYCTRLIEIDQSREMLKHNNSPSLKVQADMISLPFRTNSVDGIFSIASIHHIKGKTHRIRIINDFQKIARKEALIVITVWRFKQKKFFHEYKKQILESTYREFGIKLSAKSKIDKEIGDVNVPWKVSQQNQEIVIQRFYHLFRAVEFRHLVKPFKSKLITAFGSGREKSNFLFIGVNE
ncbi:MAG: hypothetical protein DRO88_01935 [Promethearchaeia archaeon]|nr:MAG: hypothetical protein DRO88_01935 [Candidatus Lokiarchaeia archaeon]